MSKVYKKLVDLIQEDKNKSGLKEVDYFHKDNNPPINRSSYYWLKKMAAGEQPPTDVKIGSIIEAYKRLGVDSIRLQIGTVGELVL